jgi:hypothetical protein
VHPASLALTLSMSYSGKVTLFERTHIFQGLHSTQYTYGFMIVVSAVRSHTVPRISKSYESFGDRFTTTVIDDIATSDFSQAVKGLSPKSLSTSGS